MVVSQLIKHYEDRKFSMCTLLENKKDSMQLHKQHQIYGAIQEIDCLIKILEEQRAFRKEDISQVRGFGQLMQMSHIWLKLLFFLLN